MRYFSKALLKILSMKIYDCFTFFNEYDLLEIRLKYLYPYVDKFVIAEANLTHSGKEKPYNFLDHKERYKQWEDKIHYIPVKLSTEGLVFASDQKTYTPSDGSWKLENAQRMALAEISPLVKDEDLVMVGDLDEIVNPEIFQTISLETQKSMSLLFSNYFFNCENVKHDRWWKGTVACSGAYFKAHDPQHLRDNRNEFESIPKAGWHFSYLGGVKAIQQKLSSFSHTEYNKPEFLDAKHIEKALSQGKDVLKRKHVKYKFVPISKYPIELQHIMVQYPSFIRELSFWQKLKAIF